MFRLAGLVMALFLSLSARASEPKFNDTDYGLEVFENRPFSADLKMWLTDPNIKGLQWELGQTTPNWVGIDEDTGVVFGYPEKGDKGIYSMQLTASGGDEIAEATLQIEVLDKVKPPPPPGDKKLHFKQKEFTETVSKEGFLIDLAQLLKNPDLESVRWAINKNIPSWLKFQKETGQIFGQPTETGKFKLRVVARYKNETASGDLILDVVDKKITPLGFTKSKIEFSGEYAGTMVIKLKKYINRPTAPGLYFSMSPKAPKFVRVLSKLGFLTSELLEKGNFSFDVYAHQGLSRVTTKVEITVK